MKKVILMPILVLVLTGCKKNYNCGCGCPYNMDCNVLPSVKIHDTKENAQKTCAAKENPFKQAGDAPPCMLE